VVESLPGRVYGGHLVIREFTSKQKTSAKFVILHNLEYKLKKQHNYMYLNLVNKCNTHMQVLDFV